MSVLSTPLQVN